MNSDENRNRASSAHHPISAKLLEELEPAAANRLRRTILLSATGVATAMTVVFWLIGAGKDADSIERLILPLLTGLFGVLTVIAWRGNLRGAEIGLLAVGSIVLLERIHFARNLPHAGLIPVLDAYELIMWFPCIYVIAFLLFDRKHALFFSLSLLATSLFLLRDWLIAGADRIYHADLTEFYIGQVGCIFLVYTFALVKERLVTTQKLAIDLRNFADTDFLTGVPNRRALTQALEKEIIRSKRHGDALGLILLDIDYFKKVNDSFGHDEGDRVLRRVAFLIHNKKRGSDTFGRWGGEEFLLIGPNLDLHQAYDAAQRLREVLESSGKSTKASVTASFGVTEFRLGDDVASLVKRADEALMDAKKRGRNCVVANQA